MSARIGDVWFVGNERPSFEAQECMYIWCSFGFYSSSAIVTGGVGFGVPVTLETVTTSQILTIERLVPP